jgi:hypothetical protein
VMLKHIIGLEIISTFVMAMTDIMTPSCHQNIIISTLLIGREQQKILPCKVTTCFVKCACKSKSLLENRMDEC